MKNAFIEKLDSLNHKKVLLISLSTWFVLNLIQSIFTGLAHDEAYYWMYSRQLDWGYFDHPPMIALLIKIGYSVFQNELGVRLLSVFLGIGTLYIIYLLTDNSSKSAVLFILLVFSIAISQTHLIGFLAIPDTPIVFFSALFLLVLRQYLKTDRYETAIALGLIASCMLYSKYHAVLVLFFSIIPNLRLFKRTSFYVIIAVVIVCLLPHLFWQIKHSFPTFEYHLISRSSAYKFDHTWNYIYSQILVTGPFVAIPAFYHAIKAKSENSFDLTLKYNFYGFFGFFLLSSIRGHMEPHWTAVGVLALVALAFKNISQSLKAKKWILWLSMPSILFAAFIRLGLAVEILPTESPLGKEFHNWDTWAEEIKEVAGDRKVVFTNTFQRPSKYTFYTGEFAHSVNKLNYRKNQFDIWPLEDSILNERIVLFGGLNAPFKLTTSTGETYRYDTLNDYLSYKNIWIEYDNSAIKAIAGDTISSQITIINKGNEAVRFESRDNITTSLALTLFNEEIKYTVLTLKSLKGTLEGNDSINTTVVYTIPEVEGVCHCYISLKNTKNFPAFNSKAKKIYVKK